MDTLDQVLSKPHQIPLVAKAFFSQGWAILPEKLDDMRALIELAREGGRYTKAEVFALIGGEPQQRAGTMFDGVAVIPVYGVLDKKMNLIMQVSGGTSTELLVRDIQRAAADPAVRAIVLDVDSPGGSVHGPQEVVAAVRDARKKKRVVAVANEMMVSAAYWIASAADEVVTSTTALVGSIGVVYVHQDLSAAEAAEGIKSTVFHAGRFKAAGNPHEPLTEDATSVIQARVDSYYGLFVEAVAKNRGMSKSTAEALADGRTWVGQEAIDRKLADRIGTLDQVITELAGGKRGSSPRASIAASENDMGATIKPADKDTAAEGVEKIETKAEMEARIRQELAERSATFRGVAAAFWPNDPVRASAVADELIAGTFADAKDAKAHIADLITKERKPLGRVDFGASSVDKVSEAIADGLAIKMVGERAASNIVAAERPHRFRLQNHEAQVIGGRISGIKFNGNGRQLHQDARMFAGMGLCDIAAELLRQHGVNTRGMPKDEIAAMALGWEKHGLPRSGYSAVGGGEFHTSGDFPNLLLDASNKTLLMAYTEAATSWRQWVHVAESVPDFKNINRIRLSGTSDLESVPEGDTFQQDKLADRREYYAVETRGKAFSFTRQMMINDDMNALNTLSIRMARSAERTINRSVYAILTSNPALNFDGKALFHADHNNVLVTSGTPVAGTLSVAQLSAMQLLLRKQTDPGNSHIILNNELRYIIAPAALEGTLLELLSSTANPASSQSGITNIWQNRITPVIEPNLDANSAIIYYGAGSWMDADHIEVTFLQGEESPVMEEDYDFDTKGRAMTIHQTWGVKPLDYVNIVRNDGAAT